MGCQRSQPQHILGLHAQVRGHQRHDLSMCGPGLHPSAYHFGQCGADSPLILPLILTTCPVGFQNEWNSRELQSQFLQNTHAIESRMYLSSAQLELSGILGFEGSRASLKAWSATRIDYSLCPGGLGLRPNLLFLPEPSPPYMSRLP